MNRNTGVLGGIPNQNDLNASPFQVTVVTTDQYGASIDVKINVIIRACATTSDCGGTAYCFNQVCVPYANEGEQCGTVNSRECLPDLFCYSGTCFKCRQDNDCKGNNDYCFDGSCYDYNQPGDPCTTERSENFCQAGLTCDAGICYDLPVNVNLPNRQGVLDQQFRYDMSEYFFPALNTNNLVYGASGVSPNSGLTIHPDTGLISGYPNLDDLRLSPMTISVTARNPYGNRAQGTFQLTIVECEESQQCPQGGIGQYCETRTGVCTPYADFDQPCGGSSNVQCHPQLICNVVTNGQGKCVECIDSNDCGAGQYCTTMLGGRGSGQCENYQPVGGACTQNGIGGTLCDPSLECDTAEGICYELPIMVQIPDVNAYVGTPFDFGLGSYLGGPLGNVPISCSVTGLSGSGIRLDPQFCSLVGVPLPSDLYNTPLTVTVIGKDGSGHKTEGTFNIYILECEYDDMCGDVNTRYCDDYGRCEDYADLLEPVGGPCNGPDAIRCRPGLFCDDSARPGQGICVECVTNQQCSTGNGFPAGLYCEANQCVPYSEGGEPCSQQQQCIPSFTCTGNVCYECQDDGDCEYSSYCGRPAGQNWNQCLPFRDVGETCDTTLRCYEGLDCLSGMCYDAPVVVTIPDSNGVQNQDYYFDVSPFFNNAGLRGQLTYGLTGLPPGTGLSIDPNTGVISGRPSPADLANGPLQLTVYVMDETGHRAQGSFYLNISECELDDHCGVNSFCRATANGGVCTPYAAVTEPCTDQAVVCQPGLVCDTMFGTCYMPTININIPDDFADVGESYSNAMCSYFTKAFPANARLVFSWSGLDSNTGLTIDEKSGLIYGIPNLYDLEVSPLYITITADDQAGHRAEGTFMLTITNTKDEIDVGNVEGLVHKPFAYDVSGIFEQLQNAGTPGAGGLCLGTGNSVTRPVVQPTPRPYQPPTFNRNPAPTNRPPTIRYQPPPTARPPTPRPVVIPGGSQTGGGDVAGQTFIRPSWPVGFPIGGGSYPITMPAQGSSCSSCCNVCCQMCNGGVGGVGTVGSYGSYIPSVGAGQATFPTVYPSLGQPSYPTYPSAFPNPVSYPSYPSTGGFGPTYPSAYPGTTGFPSTGYPSSGYPSGYPSFAYPGTAFPSAGYPATGFPTGIPPYSGQVGNLFTCDTSAFMPQPQIQPGFTGYPAPTRRTYQADLPATSGLSVSAVSGLLSGIPTLADLQLSKITVTGVDQTGQQHTIEIPVSFKPGTVAAPASTFQAATLFARQGQRFSRSVAPLFQVAAGSTYRIVGLPRGTGLRLDSRTGELFGVPNIFDAIAGQPMIVSLSASGPGGVVEGAVKIHVLASGGLPTSREGAGLSSRKSCRELGWETGAGTPEVCALSNVNDKCAGALKLEAAQEYCAAAGARLCTVVELEADEAKASGCALDNERVWSADNCGAGLAKTVGGSSKASLLKSVCESGAQKHPVRCCADTVVIKAKKAEDNRAPSGPETLAPISTSLGEFLEVELFKAFSDKDDDVLTFSVTGLPPGTGLTLELTSGVLTGSVNEADVTAALIQAFNGDDKSPAGQLTLSVVATDGMASVESTLILSIRADSMSVNHAPVVTFLPGRVSVTQGEAFVRSLATSFVDPDVDQLFFRIDGLPPNTGIGMDSESGMLSGTPTQVDAETGTLDAFVSVADGRGGFATAPVTIEVTKATQGGGHAPIAMPIPDAQLVLGQPVLVGLHTSFVDPDRDTLTFKVLAGLPVGSGLKVNEKSGFLFGTPTRSDVAASPMTVVIQAVDDSKKSVTETMRILVAGKANQVNQVPTRIESADLSRQTYHAMQGGEFLMDVSTHFADADADASLSYSLLGLPEGTGFRIDPVTGMVFGSPLAVDVKARQPMGVGVIAMDGHGGMAGELLHIAVHPLMEDDSSAVAPPKQQATQGKGNNKIAKLAPAGTQVSASSCETLGWTVAQGSVMCSSSKPGGKCPARASYDRATAQCAALGARLCSAAELVALSDDKACGLDTQKLWTSDACGQGSKAGRTQVTGERTLCARTRPKSKAKFRCCGDSEAQGLAHVLPVQGSVSVGAWAFVPMFAFFGHLPLHSSTTNVHQIFSVKGLPKGSGLSMDAQTGVMVGLPSAQDAMVSPMQLTVAAVDAAGTSHEIALVLVVQTASSGKNRPPLAAKGMHGFGLSSQGVSATQGAEMVLDTSLAFSDWDGDKLWYSLVGLPAGSGLNLVSSSGIIFGSPTAADVAHSPIVLTVVAMDGSGASAEQRLGINVKASNVSPDVSSSAKPVAVRSRSSCAVLRWSIPYQSTNHKVCSSASANGKCTTPMTHAAAIATCAAQGARICSATELLQDVGRGSDCPNLDKQLLWTASPCRLGAVYVEAGAQDAGVTRECVAQSSSRMFPVRCCADVAQGAELKQVKMVPSANSVAVTWSWSAYSVFSLEYRRGSKSQWMVPAGGSRISTPAFTLSGLAPRTEYQVRLVPLVQQARVEAQIATFSVRTI